MQAAFLDEQDPAVQAADVLLKELDKQEEARYCNELNEQALCSFVSNTANVGHIGDPNPHAARGPNLCIPHNY